MEDLGVKLYVVKIDYEANNVDLKVEYVGEHGWVDNMRNAHFYKNQVNAQKEATAINERSDWGFVRGFADVLTIHLFKEE